MRRTLLLTLLITLLVGGCSRELPIIQERMAVFGTWVDITIKYYPMTPF